MSLAIAIEAADGIVLAADSRATFGDPRIMVTVNDNVQKLFQLTPRLATAIVGAAETGASVILEVSNKLRATPQIDVDAAAETIRATSNEMYQKWFGPVMYIPGPAGLLPTPRPDIWLLTVGYVSNQPRIFLQGSQPPFNFAPNLSTTGFAATGVVTWAVYLLNRLYQRGLDLKIAKELAAYCIVETVSQDGRVGGPLRMAIVKPNADVETISEEEIGKIIARVAIHRESLKQSFLGLANKEQNKA